MSRDRRYPAVCPTCGRSFPAARGAIFCSRTCTRHGTPATRFWSKTDTSAGITACWPWMAGRTANGYGQHHLESGAGAIYAHRFSWLLAHPGETIPEGGVICHSCDNPPCVNPLHLFLGTTADNVADKVSKGRARGSSRPGALNPAVRLTEEQVTDIRRRWSAGVPQAALARSYDISPSQINRVVRGLSWPQRGAA